MSKSLRILVIDESVERSEFLTRILTDCGYDEITFCFPTDNVLDIVNEVNPHVILIDVLSPTRDTLEQLMAIRDEHPTPVVLLSPDSNTQTIQSAMDCGVTAYISSEITSAQAKPIIDTAMLTFASFQSLKAELGEVKCKLQHQKIVQKAKGILMSDYNLTEDDAYQKLRRYAMDKKRPMVDVARQIIEVKKLTS